MSEEETKTPSLGAVVKNAHKVGAEEKGMGLEGKTIVIGVSGGIAAYKAVEVVSGLRKLGAKTFVIMTRNATKLVAPITFRTISNEPVVTEMFEEPKKWNVEHIALADLADLFLICPATANIIGKIASGIADDFLTTTVMACTAPKLLCPAMNHHMYSNPIVQGNLDKLKKHGFHILEPEYGRLASGAYGKGRLPEPAAIIDRVLEVLREKREKADSSEDKPEINWENRQESPFGSLGLDSSPRLRGMSILVTAGPTREWIDPVRYMSNPSTGKMGYALARVAAELGAKVYLVTGPTKLDPPQGVHVTAVETTEEMFRACLSLYDRVQVVIGAAAPSDFTVIEKSHSKIKKTPDMSREKPFTLNLVPTPDILKSLGERNFIERAGKIIVGFAAETDDLVENAKAKIEAKHLNFVCANRVGDNGVGFSVDTNAVTIVFPDGRTIETGLGLKEDVARLILSVVANEARQKGFMEHD